MITLEALLNDTVIKDRIEKLVFNPQYRVLDEADRRSIANECVWRVHSRYAAVKSLVELCPLVISTIKNRLHNAVEAGQAQQRGGPGAGIDRGGKVPEFWVPPMYVQIGEVESPLEATAEAGSLSGQSKRRSRFASAEVEQAYINVCERGPADSDAWAPEVRPDLRAESAQRVERARSIHSRLVDVILSGEATSLKTAMKLSGAAHQTIERVREILFS